MIIYALSLGHPGPLGTLPTFYWLLQGCVGNWAKDGFSKQDQNSTQFDTTPTQNFWITTIVSLSDGDGDGKENS